MLSAEENPGLFYFMVGIIVLVMPGVGLSLLIEYHEAVITRVTEVGMEIRHQHGIARVPAADLDLKCQDRFQWHDAKP